MFKNKRYLRYITVLLLFSAVRSCFAGAGSRLPLVMRSGYTLLGRSAAVPTARAIALEQHAFGHEKTFLLGEQPILNQTSIAQEGEEDPISADHQIFVRALYRAPVEKRAAYLQERKAYVEKMITTEDLFLKKMEGKIAEIDHEILKTQTESAQPAGWWQAVKVWFGVETPQEKIARLQAHKQLIEQRLRPIVARALAAYAQQLSELPLLEEQGSQRIMPGRE